MRGVHRCLCNYIVRQTISHHFLGRVQSRYCGLSPCSGPNRLRRIKISCRDKCPCGASVHTPEHILQSCPTWAEQWQQPRPEPVDLLEKLWGSSTSPCSRLLALPWQPACLCSVAEKENVLQEVDCGSLNAQAFGWKLWLFLPYSCCPGLAVPSPASDQQLMYVTEFSSHKSRFFFAWQW